MAELMNMQGRGEGDGEGEGERKLPEGGGPDTDSDGPVCWVCYTHFPNARAFLKHKCGGDPNDSTAVPAGPDGNQNEPASGPDGNQNAPGQSSGNINQGDPPPLMGNLMVMGSESTSETDTSNSGNCGINSTLTTLPVWTGPAFYSQDEIEHWVRAVNWARASGEAAPTEWEAGTGTGAETGAPSQHEQVAVGDNAASGGDGGMEIPEEDGNEMLAGHSASEELNGNGMEEESAGSAEGPSAKRAKLDMGNADDTMQTD